jgi:hypothetical protein
MDERAVDPGPVQKLKLAEQAAGLQVLVAFENRLDPWPGEPTARGTGGSASQGPSAQIRRTRRAVLRDAKEQLGDLLDSVTDAVPVDSAASLVSAVDADAADQIADAITASLKANGWPRSKWRSHLLCGALAATAHAMEAGEALTKTLVTQGVTTALTSAGVPGPVADMAARAAVDTLMKLTPYRHWDDIHRRVQFLAVALCPAVENHPEVVEYCLRPVRRSTATRIPSPVRWSKSAAAMLSSIYPSIRRRTAAPTRRLVRPQGTWCSCSALLDWL